MITEFLGLRSFVEDSMSSILMHIDSIMKKDGGKAMFADMTTPEKITYVIDEVCRYGGIEKDELLGQKKQQRIVKWAKIICYILQDRLHVAVADIRKALNYDANQNVQYHTDTMRGFVQHGSRDDDYLVALAEILINLGL